MFRRASRTSGTRPGLRAPARRWQVLIAFGVALPAVAATMLGGSATPAAQSASIPVEHIVVILQENHSFNNVLGKLCLEEHKECEATEVGRNKAGEEVPLKEAPDIVPEISHSQEAQLTAMDGGKMDGFEQVSGCAAPTRNCYSIYTPKEIPSLSALAKGGAISDAFFSRDIVPSWGGHLDFFAQTLDGFVGNNPKHVRGAPRKGPGWGCNSNLNAEWINPETHQELSEPSCVPNKNGEGAYRPTPVPYVPTVADRLEEAGRTWGIYGATNPEEKKQVGPYKWTICPTFAECLYGPQKNFMHESTQLFEDAKDGKLPSFAILTPSGGVTGQTSQHNGTSMKLGDKYIGEQVSAIENGPDGKSTTIFIYYDDCGCFYDSVTPPSGLGIRLPLVIVSPYAKKGFVDHHIATNSSILAYMESVLGVNPVDSRDQTAYNFSEAFDYSQTPSPPFKFTGESVPKGSLNLPPPPPDES